LVFGAFPLGVAGGPNGVAAGPPDDFERIEEAMNRLAGDGPPLLVRMYVSWTGRASTAATLDQVASWAAWPLPWDMVLSYRDPDGGVDSWADFVANVVAQHGHRLTAVQVTAEANLAHVPAAADGWYPDATTALVSGVAAAADAKRSHGATAAIGFALAPETDPTASAFLAEVARIGGPDFAAGVDYAGIDLYPDVFGPPVPLDELDAAVTWLLRSFRHQTLPAIGIGPDVPIRVCENGWPTGPDRSEDRQADVLGTILRSVDAHRDELHVTHWELFALRDADSTRDSLFHRFGVLRDDYTPKPAFDRLCRLLADLRRNAAPS
jgi:hypothetical protein